MNTKLILKWALRIIGLEIIVAGISLIFAGQTSFLMWNTKFILSTLLIFSVVLGIDYIEDRYLGGDKNYIGKPKVKNIKNADVETNDVKKEVVKPEKITLEKTEFGKETKKV